MQWFCAVATPRGGTGKSEEEKNKLGKGKDMKRGAQNKWRGRAPRNGKFARYIFVQLVVLGFAGVIVLVWLGETCAIQEFALILGLGVNEQKENWDWRYKFVSIREKWVKCARAHFTCEQSEWERERGNFLHMMQECKEKGTYMRRVYVPMPIIGGNTDVPKIPETGGNVFLGCYYYYYGFIRKSGTN